MSKPFYLSKPIDEYVLEKELIQKYPWLLTKALSHKEMLQIQNETDVNHATMALYISLKDSVRYGSFIQKIKNQKIVSNTSSQKILWGVVPAMLYERHPEVGGGGDHIISVARELNLRAEQINVSEKAGPITNAHYIKKWMDSHPYEKIGMITLCKGSLDFRYAWNYLFTDEDKKRVHFWLNLSGSHNGTGLGDLLLKTWKSRIAIALAQKFLGMESNVVRECQSNHPHWDRPFVLDDHVKVYSLFPLPLSSHIQTTLIGRYKKLIELGPNDGMTDSYRSVYWEGKVFPIWGADHFCRTADMIPTLYKMFSYIIENDF